MNREYHMECILWPNLLMEMVVSPLWNIFLVQGLDWRINLTRKVASCSFCHKYLNIRNSITLIANNVNLHDRNETCPVYGVRAIFTTKDAFKQLHRTSRKPDPRRTKDSHTNTSKTAQIIHSFYVNIQNS